MNIENDIFYILIDKRNVFTITLLQLLFYTILKKMYEKLPFILRVLYLLDTKQYMKGGELTFSLRFHKIEPAIKEAYKSNKSQVNIGDIETHCLVIQL